MGYQFKRTWVIEDIGDWGIEHVPYHQNEDYTIEDYAYDVLDAYESGPAILRDPLRGDIFDKVIKCLIDYFNNKNIGGNKND